MLVKNVELRISKFLIYFLQLLLNTFLLPQVVTYKFHLKCLKINNEIKMTLLLSLKILSFIIFEFTYLDLHFLFALCYFHLFSIKVNILVYMMICLLQIICYKYSHTLKETIGKTNFVNTFFMNWLYLLLSILSLLCLFDYKLSNSILIKKRKDILLLELIRFTISEYFKLIKSIFKYILYSIHLVNFVSAIRLYSLTRSGMECEIPKLIFSLFLALTQDFVILFIFIFNQFFIFSAWKSNKKIIEILMFVFENNLNAPCFDKLKNDKTLNDCFFYKITHEIILKSFNDNIQFLFISIAFIINLIFIFRVKKLKRIYFKYLIFKESILFELIIFTIDGILELIFPFFLLSNYLLISNRRIIKYLNDNNLFYKKLENEDEDEKQKENKKVIFHLNLYLIKLSDYLITFISLFRIFTFNFYFQLLREISQKKCSFKLLFPLLTDEELISEIEKSKYLNIDDLISNMKHQFSRRGTKLLFITISSITEHLFLIISLISLINPLNIIKFISNIFTFFTNSKKNFNKSFFQINRQFNLKQLKLIINFIYDFFVFFPSCHIICLLSPWNYIHLVIHIWKVYLERPVNTIKKNFKYYNNRSKKSKSKKINSENYSENFNNCNNCDTNNKIKKYLHPPLKNSIFLSNLFWKLPKDWKIILKVISIHFAIFRMILFWKDLLFLLKYKLHRIKSVKDSKNDLPTNNITSFSNKLDSYKEEENFKTQNSLPSRLQNLKSQENKINNDQRDVFPITPIFDPFNSNRSLKSDFSIKSDTTLDEDNTSPSAYKGKRIRKFSLKTLKFVNESNLKLFRYNLYRHYQHPFNEIIFYPFLLIITIVTPWNLMRDPFSLFFKKTTFKGKSEEFKKILLIFLTDILTFLSTIFLITSIVHTIDTLILLYYSIRKQILKQKEFTRYYDLYYKYNFKSQIYEKMKGLVSNFIILGLILLNIFFVSRVFNLFRRIRYYLNSKIINDLWKFKHLMKIHYNNSGNILTQPILNDKMICSIAEFLPPNNIISFSCCNSYLLSVLNMNNVWKSCYNKFYTKKIKEMNKNRVLSYINPMVFENYKSLCKEVSSYLKLSSEKIEENRRDHLIGLLQVLMEETIESFLNIPHLILIPIKIISVMIMRVREYFYRKLEFFYKIESVEKIGIIFTRFNNEHERINEYLKLMQIDSEYFNIQIIGLICTFDIFLILVEIWLNIFFMVNFLVIKKIKKLENIYTLDSINCSQSSLTFIEKIKNLLLKNESLRMTNICFIMKEIMIFDLYLIYHFILFILPIIITNIDHIKPIINHFIISNNLTTDSNYPILYLFQILFSNILMKNNLYMVINLILFYLNYLYIKQMKKILNIIKSEIIYYDIIYFLLSPTGLLKFIIINFKDFLFYVLFPHYFLKNWIKIYQSENQNSSFFYSIMIQLNILLLFTFPFMLNVLIRMSISRIVIINVYAIINILILKYK